MKKLLSLLLVGIICFSLGSCGSSQSSTGTSNKEINFDEGTVIFENDFARVELVNFYEEDDADKCISLRVKNKGTSEFLFSIDEVYIGENSVTPVMKDGNSGPLPGKAQTYSYIIKTDDEEGTPLESLDLLYELDGEFRFSIFGEGEDEDTIIDVTEEYFSLKSLNLK